MVREKDLLSLIDSAYCSVLFPEHWQHLVDKVGQLLGGCGVGLYTCDTKRQSASFLGATLIEPEFKKSFVEYYCYVNPYEPAIKQLTRVGVPITDAELVPRDAMRKTEFYNDWIRPQGRDLFQVGGKVAQTNGQFTALNCHPHPKGFEAKEGEYVCLMEALLPHLSRAMQIRRVIGETRGAVVSLSSIFVSLDLAVLVLDSENRILIANQLAEQYLAEARPITTGRFGSLDVPDSGSAKALRAAISLCRSDHSPVESMPVRLTATDGTPYLAWVQASPRGIQEFPGNELGVAMTNDDAVVVLISTAEDRRSIATGLLEVAYGLTAAEARLASALADGVSLSAYALEQKISQNTARAQLAKVFEKSGTSRQAELVAQIWRNLSGLPAPE